MPEMPFTITLTDQPEYQPLLTGSPQTVAMRSGRVYLKPGEECGQHTTGDHEEQLVVLAGRGQSQIGPNGEESLDITANQIVYIPPQTHHNIINTGSDPLIYIYCVAPIPKEG